MDSAVGLRGHRIQNQERADSRRRGILMAAAAVFAAQGYTSASLDDVAARIGVTKGVIYYYFRGKEEILTEIRATAIQDSLDRLELIIARAEPPDVMLRAAVYDLVAHIFNDLDRYANILTAGEGLSAESHDLVRGLQRRFERLIRGIVERGIEQGLFADRDPRITTFTLLRAALGVADWFSPEGSLTPDIVASQVTDQVVAGVLKRPDQ